MSRVICIVHSEDTLSWATFIKNLFLKQRSSKYEVRSFLAKDLAQSNPSSSRLDVEDAETLIVVFSPEHLLFLSDHPDFTYQGLARGGQKGVLLFCGTIPSDLECTDPEGGDLRTRFPSYKDWTAVEHSDVNSLPSILETIQPLPGLTYQLIPDRVRCENNSTVTVSFSDVIAAKPTDLQVALFISNDDGISEENVEVTWINDKAVFFKAPERREGPAKVRVIVKGNQIPGTSNLEYESSCELISHMMQLYIYAMNHLISLVLSKSLISKSELDTFLFKIFTEDEPEGIQPKAFEELFGIYRYNPNMKSQAELPTLLHFASKFGFEKFHSWLQNLPDAELASRIQSSGGLQIEKVNKSKSKACAPPAVPCPVFKPPVDDHLLEEPEEDYLDMETTTRMRFENQKKTISDNNVWRQDAPVMKEYQINQESFDDTYTTFGAPESEDDYEDFYEPVDRPYDSQSETVAEQEEISPPQTTISQGDRPVFQSGATTDPGQQKLVEIMTQVKCGELTMEEANILFEEWKIQHSQKQSRPNASRSKPSSYEVTAPFKPPAVHKDAKAYPALPDTLTSQIWKRGSDFSEKHSSTASSSGFESSRSSTASAFGHSSGADVDPQDEDLSSRRSSGCSVDGNSVAPPIPARYIKPNPSKGITLPRMTPGKFEGLSGKSDKEKTASSSTQKIRSLLGGAQ